MKHLQFIVNTSRHIELMQACNFMATSVDLYNLSNTYIQQLRPPVFMCNLGRQLWVRSTYLSKVFSISLDFGFQKQSAPFAEKKAGGKRKIIQNTKKTNKQTNEILWANPGRQKLIAVANRISRDATAEAALLEMEAFWRYRKNN